MRKKERSTDFTIENLPSNRIELFFDVLKNNWRKLLLIGLILLLFTFPLFAVNYYFDYIGYSLTNDYQAGIYTIEQYEEYVRLSVLLRGLFSGLAISIIGIALAGIMKIIRKMCFLDPVFFINDFLSGIKDNGIIMFLTTFTIGLFVAFNSFISIQDINGLVKGIAICVSLAAVFPVLLIMIAAIPIYKIKFITGYISFFRVFVRFFFKNILVYFIMLTPFAFMFINNIAIKYAVSLAFVILFAPLYLVGLFDFCCDDFDKAINKEMFPQNYRKGLYGSKTKKENEN